ncbi:MAG: PQQ-binding-like beta-propeller repeat protein [Acidobacteriota bacterium]
MKRLRIAVVMLVALASVFGLESVYGATVKSNKSSTPPNSSITVTGTGFGASELVDVYLDTVDMMLAVSDAAGAFSVKLKIPAEAVPGNHTIIAAGRKSGTAAQKPLVVAASWQQVGFNGRHSGANPYENILSPWTVSSLNQEWETVIGAGLYTTPVILNGAYLFVTSTDGKLYKINTETGKVIWSKLPSSGIFSQTVSPALASTSTGWLIIAATDTSVSAVKESDGSIAWSYNMPQGVSYTITVDGGIAYFNRGSQFHAVTVNNGKPVGGFPITLTGSMDSCAAVTGGKIFLTVPNGVTAGTSRLYAYSAATGIELWHADLPSNICGAPANGPIAANGIVYIGVQRISGVESEVHAFNLHNGARLWNTGTTSSANIGDSICAAPVVYKGSIYVPSNDHYLYAFNARTGAFRWKLQLSAQLAAPIVANGVLYVATYDNSLHAVDCATGTYLWGAVLNYNMMLSPLVVDGRLYATTYYQSIFCFSLNPELRAQAAAPLRKIDPKELVPDYTLTPQSAR